MNIFRNQFRTRLMETLTTRVSHRFTICNMNPNQFSWAVVNTNEVITVKLLPNYAIKLEYKGHAKLIYDTLDADKAQLLFAVSTACMMIINEYRERRNLIVKDDKLVKCYPTTAFRDHVAGIEEVEERR